VRLHSQTHRRTGDPGRQPAPSTSGTGRLGYKHCGRCDRDLPVLGNFYKDKHGGFQPGCKDCRRAAARDYYRQNTHHEGKSADS
jgi:hypothetical protein